jgi:hypothetical protein
MADYAISNVPRRVVFAPSGVGPYAFTFEILAAADIAVYKGTTLLTLTTDYSVTINANGTGSVTLVASAGTDNIAIVGAKTIQRTTDFVTGGDFFANTLNDELDAQTIYIQQVAETAERSLKAPVTDPTSINMTLPTATSRANKYLSFDANGNPSVSEAFTDAYIGGASVDPTADNSGNPLTAGDLYFNTAVGEMRVYDGTSWVALTDFGGTVSTLTVVNDATLPSIIGPTNITSATLPSPTITGTATVAAANLSGNLSVGGTANVTGAATLSNTLAVTGATTLNGATTINNSATIGVNTTVGVLISTSGTGDITVASTTGFPSSGLFQVDSEIIAYTGKTATTFTGITRGQSGTTSTSHTVGTRVHTTGVKIKGSIDDPVAININSTETALRLTQIGTGDVLRVEDSASPDTSRLTISNSGALTANASATFNVVNFNSSISYGSTASETWYTYGSKQYDSSLRFFYETHDFATEGLYNYPILQRHQKLSADGTAIGSAIADYFGATSQANLALDSWYEFEYVLYFTKTTAGTLTFTIATDQAPQLLSAEYMGSPVGGVGVVGAPQTAALIKSTSTAAALPNTGSLTLSTNHAYRIRGIIKTNAITSSLMKLRVTNSAGTITPLAGSYQKIWRISPLDAAGTFS